jgi:hypothetical protein
MISKETVIAALFGGEWGANNEWIVKSRAAHISHRLCRLQQRPSDAPGRDKPKALEPPGPTEAIHSKAQAKREPHKTVISAPRLPLVRRPARPLLPPHNCTQPLTSPTLRLVHLGIPTTQPILTRQTLRRQSICPKTREREARTGAEERTRTSEKYPSPRDPSNRRARPSPELRVDEMLTQSQQQREA